MVREERKKDKLRTRLGRRAVRYKEKLERGGVGEKMLGRNQGKGVCEGSE